MKTYRALIFTGLAIIIIFSPIARGAVHIWSITPVMIIAYSMIFLHLLININTSAGTKISLSKINPIDTAISLFLFLAVASFVFSTYKHDSLYALFRLIAYAGLYYVVSNDFDHRMRRRIVWIAIFTGVFISAYGLLQYVGLLDKSWWHTKMFLSATYRNHNSFAGWLELVLPITIMLAIKIVKEGESRKRMIEIICIILALAIMITAFLLSQSRGAWISLALSILVMAIVIMKRSEKMRLIIIAAIVVSTISLLYFTHDIVSSRMSTLTSVADGEDMSMEGRYKMWQGTVRMIEEKPILGSGVGCFDSAFYRYRPEGFSSRAVYAHNDYLQMASEMGVLAPLLMVFIFATIMWGGLKNIHANPYTIGCATGLLSMSLHGVADFNFHIPSNMILFAVWMAIIRGELSRSGNSETHNNIN